jgi:transposase
MPHVPAGRHAVVVMDQAGWHSTKRLEIPNNISILHLPPYSPELNPQEQVWQYKVPPIVKNTKQLFLRSDSSLILPFAA